jgi:hypothetical protein
MRRHDRDGHRKTTRQNPVKRVSEKGLMTLQLEKGSLEDLKLSFEKGDDALYSIKSPTTTVQSVRGPIAGEMGGRRMSHVEKEVVEGKFILRTVNILIYHCDYWTLFVFRD